MQIQKSQRFYLSAVVLLFVAMLAFNYNQRQALQVLTQEKEDLIGQHDSLTALFGGYFQKSLADEAFIEDLVALLSEEERDSIVVHKALTHPEFFPNLEEIRISQATQFQNWRAAQRFQLNTLGKNHKKLQREYQNIHAQNDSAVEVIQLLIDSVLGLKDNLLQYYGQLIELDSINKLNLNVLEIEHNGNLIYYIGEKSNGVAHGYGVGLWSTGSIYKGLWANNLRHGKGWYRWKDGELYEGMFKEGQRTGEGTYHWKDKTYYKGEWLDNFRHGFGGVYYPDGTLQYEGNWVKDKFIQKGDAGKS